MGIMCVTCLNLLKMGIQTGAIKSLGSFYDVNSYAANQGLNSTFSKWGPGTLWDALETRLLKISRGKCMSL